MADYYLSQLSLGSEQVTFISTLEPGLEISYADSNRNGPGLDVIGVRVSERNSAVFAKNPFTSYFVRDGRTRSGLCNFLRDACSNGVVITDESKVNKRAAFFAGVLSQSNATLQRLENAFNTKKITPRSFDPKDPEYNFTYSYEDASKKTREVKISYSPSPRRMNELTLKTDTGESYHWFLTDLPRAQRAKIIAEFAKIKSTEQTESYARAYERLKANQTLGRELPFLNKAIDEGRVSFGHVANIRESKIFIFDYSIPQIDTSSIGQKVVLSFSSCDQLTEIEFYQGSSLIVSLTPDQIDPSYQPAIDVAVNKLRLLVK